MAGTVAGLLGEAARRPGSTHVKARLSTRVKAPSPRHALPFGASPPSTNSRKLWRGLGQPSGAWNYLGAEVTGLWNGVPSPWVLETLGILENLAAVHLVSKVASERT